MKAFLGLAVLGSVFLTSCSVKIGISDPGVESDDYRFELVDSRWPAKPFVVRLPASNKDGVRALESYIWNDKVFTKSDGYPDIGIISGTVIRCSATTEHPWHFCLDGNNVTFSDVTAVSCDASFQYIEDDIQDWMRSARAFCPWDTRRLIRKISRGTTVLYEK